MVVFVKDIPSVPPPSFHFLVEWEAKGDRFWRCFRTYQECKDFARHVGNVYVKAGTVSYDRELNIRIKQEAGWFPRVTQGMYGVIAD